LLGSELSREVKENLFDFGLSEIEGEGCSRRYFDFGEVA
jgi:hypothetical protein